MVWFRPLAQLREQLPRPHPVGGWARSARVTEPCAPRWRGEGHGVLQQSRGCWRTVRGVQHSAPRTTTGGKESVTWRRFACENPDQGGKNRREHTKSVRRPLDTLLPIALHPTSLVGGREHFTDNDGGRVPRPGGRCLTARPSNHARHSASAGHVWQIAAASRCRASTPCALSNLAW